MKALLGIKHVQSQAFTQDGKRVPTTTIEAGPCWVTGVVTEGNVRRLQLGFGITKHMAKPREGQMKKAGLDKKPRFLREVDLEAASADVSVGTEIHVADVFQVGDTIRVTGTSKGKGFAGVVKRHGFHGGPRTHGQSDRERAPGSIGQTTTPGRVYRGKRMAGRMGSDRVTVTGLKVVAVDPEKNLLMIKGLVPGSKGGLLIVQKEG
ncbi:50S ribosomal protein L3 [Candidatus Gottesmanbacteria bacterium RBG_13_45_10]|uniref:Large ribosomal subunit protein uL3 n=1 Tax=Candidatus Gottesmanbacteria bacterium RBG_13_45_10 TaxID=1798370 RepID=A0A1F5ZH76_9BACT|nr:MAG: 50S ribosomal protein L3 [Candidatus Gottesmanbacteria bacterium RBG_13_45_10]